MGVVFQKLPMGNYLGFLWFFLLFFAGITSSVAMAQPLISFLKEQFKFSHKKATFIIAGLIFISVHFIVIYLEFGFLEELDYWAGTFLLVVVALIEVIIFGWIYGMDKSWDELNRGADLKVPRIFYFIIKYVTPIYLVIILGFWTVDSAIPTLQMEGVAETDVTTRWLARGFMVAIFLILSVMVHYAWKKNDYKYEQYQDN